MNKLVIIGAGGHGKVIADNALKNGYTDICFVDDRAAGSCMDFPIAGTCADLFDMNDGKTDFIIGIGNNAVRKKIAEAYDLHWVTLIHPSAQVAVNVTIGKGTAIMAGAVINACTTVGEHCIINTRAVIEHDNIIENYAHISPNAALGGTVHLGECSWIGIGAAVINNIDICENCIVGAGDVVIKNIKESGTYVGVPARKIK
jgi:sugar O-acyltransferase (sialic acid O-acetyltransferase NeuD family)